jgi:enoyl-CoA hydratase/carnithine racemase
MSTADDDAGVARVEERRKIPAAADDVIDTGPGDAVRYEISASGIAIVTLNRPERLNTWGGDIATAFYASLDRAEEDPAVRVIVLTGRGNAFCAGAQLGALGGASGSSKGSVAQSLANAGQRDLTELVGERQPYYLTTLCKPVIAAINGSCAGIGLTQALMCDVRFAAAGAKFAASFARRGLVAEHGISWILPRLAGWGVALDLLLSGRTFLADEAVELGLVKEVVAPEQLMKRAMAYAEDIARNCSPASMAVIKRQAYGDAMREVAAASSRAETLLRESLQRRDVIEGITSFLEKRAPSFPGMSVSTSALHDSCGTGRDDHGELEL